MIEGSGKAEVSFAKALVPFMEAKPSQLNTSWWAHSLSIAT
jgi:hypothetical protein